MAQATPLCSLLPPSPPPLIGRNMTTAQIPFAFLFRNELVIQSSRQLKRIQLNSPMIMRDIVASDPAPLRFPVSTRIQNFAFVVIFTTGPRGFVIGQNLTLLYFFLVYILIIINLMKHGKGSLVAHTCPQIYQYGFFKS